MRLQAVTVIERKCPTDCQDSEGIRRPMTGIAFLGPSGSITTGLVRGRPTARPPPSPLSLYSSVPYRSHAELAGVPQREVVLD